MEKAFLTESAPDAAARSCKSLESGFLTIVRLFLQLVAKVFPSQKALEKVKKAVAEYWDRHPDRYIAIHCAYGKGGLETSVILRRKLLQMFSRSARCVA